ncbi:MAG TPA: TrbI/VirB10 family protein [Vicinamibacteria bacterium]
MRNFRFSVIAILTTAVLAAGPLQARADVRVPAGTVIPVRFQTTVSSVSSGPEDRVIATVRDNVRVGGRVAIPAGSELRGHVVSAQRSGRVKGRAAVSVDFNRLTVRGRTYDIDTRQLTVVAPDSHGRDAKVVGGGAGAGAIIGAIADGKEGAVKGALIGGAAGTGVVLGTRGKEVRMPAGSRWRLRLAQSFVVD